MPEPRVVTDEEAAELRRGASGWPITHSARLTSSADILALLDHREALMAALERIVAIHANREDGYRTGRSLNAPEVDVELCAKLARPLLARSHGGGK